MADTLLDKISLGRLHIHTTDSWINGKIGSIEDVCGDCNFRFIDLICESDGNIRDKYPSDDAKLTCPVIACGIVGFWLHHRNKLATAIIFSEYFNIRKEKYHEAHKNDADTWERDLYEEYICKYHIKEEKEYIKQSEAIYPYLTENDCKQIQSITNNYIKFAKAKRKELYPPTCQDGKELEEEFLSYYKFRGVAYTCIEWFRDEYDLPPMGPHWNGKGFKMSDEQIIRHKEDFSYVLEETSEMEDIHDLECVPSKIMEEINQYLRQCHSKDDCVRYIISLLFPFKYFADVFYPVARINGAKRQISDIEKWKSDYQAMPDDATDNNGKPIRPTDQIAACNKSIERHKQDIEYWDEVSKKFYWFAQHGITQEWAAEDNHEMCECLSRWWELMISFAHKLAALALTYGIKIMDVQEDCQIFLVDHILPFDYVDNQFITSNEHARKLLQDIEMQTGLTDIEFKILNVLRFHEKEINVGLKDSSPQIYDFIELNLYGRDEINQCCKKMKSKGWINYFFDNDEGLTYWHELEDKGRAILRRHLTDHPELNNSIVNNDVAKPKRRRGRPSKIQNKDIHYTLVYKPYDSSEDSDEGHQYLTDLERNKRILEVDKALREKYKWINVLTPKAALFNLFSGKGVVCGIIWNECVTVNAKTAFIKMLVNDKVCELMDGCRGVNFVIESQFNIKAQYRKPKAEDISIIRDLEMILKPELYEVNYEDNVWSYTEKAYDQTLLQSKIKDRELGLTNHPKGRIL